MSTKGESNCAERLQKYEAALTQIFSTQGWVWVGELLPPEIVKAVKAKWHGESENEN